MAQKSALTINIEYAGLRLACGAVNVLPYSFACLLARLYAWTAFSVLGIQKRRTIDRIRSVFPEKSVAEAKRIGLFSLQNIFLNAVEMIRAPKIDKDWITNHVKDIAEYHRRLKEITDEGNGAVIMVPHTGNWYMAAWAMAKYGLPLFAIAAKQRNPKINEWMKRQYCDIEVVERGGSGVMRDILKRLRGGKGFAILPDLRVPQLDTKVPFLNGTANVSHSAALFALSAHAPIVVACMRRENGIHTFDHLATLRPDFGAPDRKEEARRLTVEAMKLLDEAVRKTPEQWFWFNKRWILQPVNG